MDAVTVAVTVDDDDSAGIDVSVASLEVDEGDASGESYTVEGHVAVGDGDGHRVGSCGH